ncbi:MAG TPA: barstar family protein [Acidobacteriaceae bacterium]|nr:barstar family protein [Acidobacteriaceae bacterium]
MVAFARGDEGRLDWKILRDGSIALYRNPRYIEEDIEWLRRNSYEIHSLDCTTWFSDEAMYTEFQRSLSFPGYFGKNLDALNDSLSEMAVPENGGMALVLSGFDVYAKGCGGAPMQSGRTRAGVLLDILARNSRYFLLTGRRMVVLVQSNDPLMHFEQLGGSSTRWNGREWLNHDGDL